VTHVCQAVTISVVHSKHDKCIPPRAIAKDAAPLLDDTAGYKSMLRGEIVAKHAWDGVVPKGDLLIYDRAGFGRKGGLGRRPAILIIDVQYRSVGPRPAPILEAMETYPTSCGEAGWKAVHAIARLLEVARAKRVPIFYPVIAPKKIYDAGRIADKVPTVMHIDDLGYEVVTEIGPLETDVVVPKNHPSAFFGTPLASYLVDRGVDTVLLCGCTTSGCIRATAIDAFSYNLRAAVVEECVYDRGTLSHAVNLFDINQKYADVIWLREALAYVGKLRAARER
jgi:maleamate amidohydrolase